MNDMKKEDSEGLSDSGAAFAIVLAFVGVPAVFWFLLWSLHTIGVPNGMLVIAMVATIINVILVFAFCCMHAFLAAWNKRKIDAVLGIMSAASVLFIGYGAYSVAADIINMREFDIMILVYSAIPFVVASMVYGVLHGKYGENVT